MAITFQFAQFELTRDEDGNQQDVRHDIGLFGFGDAELIEMAFDNLPSETGIKLVDVGGCSADFGKMLLDMALDPDCRETTELNYASIATLIDNHGVEMLEAFFQTDAMLAAVKNGHVYGSGRTLWEEGINYAVNMGLIFHEWSHGQTRRQFVENCEGEEWQEIPPRAKNCPGMMNHLFAHHTEGLEEFEIRVSRYGSTTTEFVFFDNEKIQDGLRM